MFRSIIRPRKSNAFPTLVLATLLLAGCSANGLFLRYFYGEIDDKLYDRIVAYATFTETQKSQIKQSVDEYKDWHQLNELPRYATFFEGIADQISSNRVTANTILANFEKAREFARISFQQSPFYDSTGFLKTLTDQQVIEIENHFEQQDEKFNQWLQQQQSDQDNEERLKKIVKNTKRIADVNLSTEQQSIIKQGLEQIQSDPIHRHKIYNRWQAEFIRILNNRKNKEFSTIMSTHIANYQNLVKLDNPQRYESNQIIAAKLITQVINNLNNKQRMALLDRLKTTRSTLQKISSG